MKNLIFPVLIGLGLAGCSQSTKDKKGVAIAQFPATESPAERPPAPAKLPADLPQAPTTPVDRTVVYEGKMELVVDHFERASASIDSLIKQHGAYLGTAHETRSDGRPHQQMTIKVHPEQFSLLVAALGRLGRVENKDVASADVTADILAASNALSEKQTVRAKYQQLLAKTTDPAQVQRLVEQEHQAQTDIVTAQNQLRQFGAQSKWATLSLYFYQLLPSPEPSERLPAFAPQFLESFTRGWAVVLGLLVLLTNLWPLVLFGGASAWGLHRWRMRRQTPA